MASSVNPNPSTRHDRARLVSVILGIVLICASVLKNHQLYTDPVSHFKIKYIYLFQLVLVQAEFAFGLWLLVGFFSGITRWVSIVVFGVFLSISTGQAISGSPSCGCFGRYDFPPWAIALFDLAAIVSLAVLPPHSARPVRPRWFTIAFLVALSVHCVLIPIGLLRISSKPLLVTEPSLVQISPMLRGSSASQPFRLTNTSDLPVEVERIVTSCPCLSVSLPPGPIPPASSVEALVHVELASVSDFAGRLLIQVEGKRSSGIVAFSIEVAIDVRSDKMPPP